MGYDRARYLRERARRLNGPKAVCLCGCGATFPAHGARGEVRQYASGHNPASHGTRFQAGHAFDQRSLDTRIARGKLTGPGHPGWKGGAHRVSGGYYVLTVSAEEAPRHPTARPNGALRTWIVRRSHKVWNDAHPNNPVRPGEQVHHLNHVRDDDRAENLLKLTDAEHRKLHPRTRRA